MNLNHRLIKAFPITDLYSEPNFTIEFSNKGVIGIRYCGEKLKRQSNDCMFTITLSNQAAKESDIKFSDFDFRIDVFPGERKGILYVYFLNEEKFFLL